MDNITKIIIAILSALGLTAVACKYLDVSKERAQIAAEAEEKKRIQEAEEAERSHQRKLKETSERLAQEAKKAEEETRKQEELYSKFDAEQLFQLEKVRLETEKAKIEAKAEVDKVKAEADATVQKVKAESNAELERVKTETRAEVDKMKAAADAKKNEDWQKRYIIENGIDAASTILLRDRRN